MDGHGRAFGMGLVAGGALCAAVVYLRHNWSCAEVRSGAATAGAVRDRQRALTPHPLPHGLPHPAHG